MWDDVTAAALPEHVDAVVDLTLAATPRCGDTVVVAVDGPSGSGKTTLALGVRAALAEQTGGDVGLVHMDEIYPGWDGLAAAPGLLADQVLAPLSRGEPAAHRLWSWVRDAWVGTRVVEPGPLLVVEGCGSSVGAARPYVAVSVFVEADRDLRRRRGLARDGAAYEPHWDRWAAREAELFEGDCTRGRADLVIDTSSL
jgi:uridine kinase